MQSAHAEIPPGTIPTRLLSDHNLRECGADPVHIRQLENELTEMGLGLGISFGGIFKKVAKIGTGLLPGPLQVGARSLIGLTDKKRPGSPAQLAPGRPFKRRRRGRAFGRRRGGLISRVTRAALAVKLAEQRRAAGLPPRVLEPRITDMQYRPPEGDGWWTHAATGRQYPGPRATPPSREAGWAWSSYRPRVRSLQPPGPTPISPIGVAPKGPTLEERIRGIIGTIGPVIPQLFPGKPVPGPITTPAVGVPPPAPIPWAPAAPSPVVITTGARPAAAAAMPPWLLPAALGVAALVVLPMITKRAS